MDHNRKLSEIHLAPKVKVRVFFRKILIKLKTSRIVITSIFLSLFILGTVLIFTTPSSIKITYGLVAETEDNERRIRNECV